MYRLEKQYRSTRHDVSRSSLFRSFLVCKDVCNQLCIVGARTPLFDHFNQPYLQGEILTKRNIVQATIRAHSRGRPIPNHHDTYNIQPVRFKVVHRDDLNPSQYVDVYMLV